MMMRHEYGLGLCEVSHPVSCYTGGPQFKSGQAHSIVPFGILRFCGPCFLICIEPPSRFDTKTAVGACISSRNACLKTYSGYGMALAHCGKAIQTTCRSRSLYVWEKWRSLQIYRMVCRRWHKVQNQSLLLGFRWKVILTYTKLGYLCDT